MILLIYLYRKCDPKDLSFIQLKSQNFIASSWIRFFILCSSSTYYEAGILFQKLFSFIRSFWYHFRSYNLTIFFTIKVKLIACKWLYFLIYLKNYKDANITFCKYVHIVQLYSSSVLVKSKWPSYSSDIPTTVRRGEKVRIRTFGSHFLCVGEVNNLQYCLHQTKN